MEQMQCFCANATPKLVTVDNESFCRGCGKVFGYEAFQEKTGVSRVNLFLRTETGGKKVRLANSSKKLHIHSNDNGKISAICDKLAINGAMQDDILFVYNNVLRRKFSKAIAACFAIYYVCRSNGFSFDERKVIDIVCVSFNVQSAPTVLAAFSKVNKSTDFTGDAWFAIRPGMKKMPTTTEANPQVFYLRKHVQKLCEEHPEISFDFLHDRATTIFKRLTRGNADTRAKEAVKAVIQEACLI